MASTPLRQQLSTMRQSFFDEGLLDHGQVSYLETLENEDDPDFIENLFTLFLRDSSKYIASIEKALETTLDDFPFILERMMYRLKGSSASIGATKINDETNKLRGFCHEGDLESAKASLQNLKAEHANFKQKLAVYVGILTVLEGSLEVGFVTSNPGNRLITKVLQNGDVFVFPINLVHFQRNVGKSNAVALAALSSQNAGVITIANAVFGTIPEIPDDVLAKAFQLDKNVVNFQQSKF
uniref:Germin-like protein n=1 Tax=Populus alba TaxID=43335 RepID=A0A4U5P4V5_POPAL|nr:hypothetical protein D5086_0000225180 [Populus alba]